MLNLDSIELYLSIIDNMDEGAYVVDKNRTIMLWSKGAEKISGRSKEEMIGRHCPESGLSHIDLCGNKLCKMDCPLTKTMLDGNKRAENVFLLHKDGYRVPIAIKAIPIIFDDAIEGAIEIFHPASVDVYDDNLIKSLSKAATKDSLTGLPNRGRAMAYLDFRINEYKRFKQGFGILYMDIDDFSNVNNTYGHDMGDEVLKNITSSLRGSKISGSMIARLGGEEFLGIFPLENDKEILNYANICLNLIRETRTIYNNENISPTISIGATAYRENDTIESLIKRADTLLYKSKNTGKNKISTDLI